MAKRRPAAKYTDVELRNITREAVHSFLKTLPDGRIFSRDELLALNDARATMDDFSRDWWKDSDLGHAHRRGAALSAAAKRQRTSAFRQAVLDIKRRNTSLSNSAAVELVLAEADPAFETDTNRLQTIESKTRLLFPKKTPQRR